MAIENNPLRQYFRRPAIYLKLPSGGKNYAPGVINMPESGELPVYPMTAIDEITTKTPDALFNGTAVVEIIKSCVPGITDPWNLSSVDLDAVLIAVKSATGGNDLEVNSICPKCSEEGKYGVNLVGLLSTLKAGDYDNELVINELTLKFRPLTFREMNLASLGQFELQRVFNMIESITDFDEKTSKTKEALKTITDVTMNILSQTIEYIKTPSAFVDQNEYILDFLRNCDKNMYVQIRDYNATLKQQTEVRPLKVKCVSCGHDYEQQFTLNTSDFFD
jgi:hypothetical protein